jgi:hypothetical protein
MMSAKTADAASVLATYRVVKKVDSFVIREDFLSLLSA